MQTKQKMTLRRSHFEIVLALLEKVVKYPDSAITRVSSYAHVHAIKGRNMLEALREVGFVQIKGHSKRTVVITAKGKRWLMKSQALIDEVGGVLKNKK